MKPLILSFFAVLLGYSFFFDKDDEIKLRNVDQIFYESQNRRIISLRNKIFVLKYLFI